MEKIDIIITMVQVLHPVIGAFFGSLSGLSRDLTTGEMSPESKGRRGFVFVGTCLGTFAGFAIYERFSAIINIYENTFICFVIGSSGLSIMIIFKRKIPQIFDAVIARFVKQK